jgi:hypothetical protein
MRHWALSVALLAVLACGGCATPRHVPPSAPLDPVQAPDAQLEARILALDPHAVSDDDVRLVLARGPTPRIVLLHGGIYPVHLLMESFSRFLVGMGYPEAKLRHPGDGRRSHSPYEDSARIAGLLAWNYEREALMPMMIGHSQGGIQLVKVLYELDGLDGPVRVWNPLTETAEERTTIVDPLSGAQRPVVGLKVGYASVVGSGGAALMLPNQWSMARRLRLIPDTVGEFTGYRLALDLVAWDVPGAASDYRALGTARVRNVELPIGYSHVFVPSTSHLVRDPATRAWINAYSPSHAGEPPPEAGDNGLWAADVWYHVKKHWVLQAQELLRARRTAPVVSLDGPDTP